MDYRIKKLDLTYENRENKEFYNFRERNLRDELNKEAKICSLYDETPEIKPLENLEVIICEDPELYNELKEDERLEGQNILGYLAYEKNTDGGRIFYTIKEFKIKPMKDFLPAEKLLGFMKRLGDAHQRSVYLPRVIAENILPIAEDLGFEHIISDWRDELTENCSYLKEYTLFKEAPCLVYEP